MNSWLSSHGKALLLLAVLSVGIYASSLGFDFVWDDRLLILNNPYVQDVRLLGEGLVSDFWKMYEDPSRFRHYYRPLVSLSYFLDYSIWKENPAGYHATNVALHLVNVLLVFGVSFLLFRSSETALVAAAVFAAHPIHTESVTWISGRTDLLASAFALGSFLCFLKITEEPHHGRWTVASCILYVLALLSKEVAIVLPVALVIYLRQHSAPQEGIRYLRTALASQVVLGIVYLLIRVLGLHMPILVEGARPVWLLMFNLPRILSRYLLKLVAPVELHAHDPMAWALSDRWPLVASALLVLLAAISAVAWLGGRDKRASLGGAWILIFLLPVLNAGTFTDVLVAERFLYLPSAGFCWIVGSLYERAVGYGSSSRRIFRIAAVTVVFLAGLRTIYRNAVWSDELVLFEHMCRSSPHYPLPHILLGEAHQEAGDAEGALREFQEALQLEPRNCRLLNAIAVAQLELGVYRRSGSILDEGFDFVQRSLEICPQDDYLHHTLGEYYLRQDDVESALIQLKKSLALNPYKVSYYYNIGAILFASGRKAEARPFLEEFVRRGPRGTYRNQALEWLSQEK